MSGTLKQNRLNANMTQAVIADHLKTNIPFVSNVENCIDQFSLEQCVDAEQFFNTKIEWHETITPRQKFDTIQSLIDLSQRYPLPVVAEWFARTYRREKNPERTILTFAKITGSRFEEEKLLPNL